MPSKAPRQPVFYFDLGSPRCYLLAERIMADLPVVPEWEPVLATDLRLQEPEPDRAVLERAADGAGHPAVALAAAVAARRRTAALAATYAKHIGRAVAFSLACFRQTFAGGRDLGDESTVLIAAAACEMHPSAVLKGIGLRSVTTGLEQASARAGAEIVIAGGAESMSLIPRGGHKLAPNPWFVEHRPEVYMNMGLTAERLHQKYDVSREDADAFAYRSHQNALRGAGGRQVRRGDRAGRDGDASSMNGSRPKIEQVRIR